MPIAKAGGLVFIVRGGVCYLFWPHEVMCLMSCAGMRLYVIMLVDFELHMVGLLLLADNFIFIKVGGGNLWNAFLMLLN